jgi:hypothetical protein
MNVKKVLKACVLVMLPMFILSSCKDIIAKNISGNTPEIITPTLNDTLAKSAVTFTWNEMKGATKYRLQIASPSFENISSYVLDTTITKTTFAVGLDSNQYEYKLTAINAGYESNVLGPIRFWVGKSSTGNSSASLVLSTPTNNTFVNKTFDGRFTWLAVDKGTNYEFELRKGGTFTSGTNVYTMDPGNTLDKTLPSNLLPLSPGEYTWRVISNSGSTYLTQSIGKFTVDTLSPNQATLLTPTNNSTLNLSDSITFTWSNGTSTASFQSSVTSTLEIASDVTFSSILYTLSVVDFQTKKLKLSSLISGKTYYWRVKNKDPAGNIANPSSVFQLITNKKIV